MENLENMDFYVANEAGVIIGIQKGDGTAAVYAANPLRYIGHTYKDGQFFPPEGDDFPITNEELKRKLEELTEQNTILMLAVAELYESVVK